VTKVLQQQLWRPALLSLGMSLASACTGTPNRPSPAPPLQALQEEPRWRLPPRPHPVPRPARKPVPAPPPGAPTAQPGPAAPQPGAEAGKLAAITPFSGVPTRQSRAGLVAPPPPTGELVGLDQQKAIRLFGRAAEKIERPPATVWRYKAPNCQLDLFFYLDLRSGRMRTLHYAFKGDVGDVEKRQDCLRAIVAARAGRTG
jgi:hypothetical protein